MIWTPPQRRAITVLLVGILLYATIRYFRNPHYVSNPQPAIPPRYEDLADRIDPNTADAATLAALPQIGEKRARDIVTYRQQFVATHPGERAFKRPEDLARIRGIGPAMIVQLSQYFSFPATRPSTAPS